MNCLTARDRVFRELDGVLGSADRVQLEAHLATCISCARERRLLMLPRRVGRALPLLQPGPYFYQKLRMRIESEGQSVTLWQIVLGLSSRVVPALAAVTLALLCVFAYDQIEDSKARVFQAYDHIFMTGDRAQRMVIADQGDITDESVLQALVEDESTRRPATNPAAAPKK